VITSVGTGVIVLIPFERVFSESEKFKTRVNESNLYF